MKTNTIIGALALLALSYSHASTIVYGNSTTAPFGFTTPVVVKAYDQHTGTFYCGIENQVGLPSDTFSLAKALRPSPSSIPKFVGIGTDTILKNKTLEFLTIIPRQACNHEVNPIFLGMTILNNAQNSQTAVTVSTSDGSSVVTSPSMNGANGLTTSGMVNIAADHCFVMAALRPNGNGNFGSVNSGLGLINVQRNPLTLRTINANTGLPGNLAVPFDGSITQLKGDSGGDDVTFSAAAEDINQVAMIYDEIFNRFYIGVQIITGADPADIGKSVVVAFIDEEEGNRIELFPIVADSAIDQNQDEIIVTQGDNINLRVIDLGIMHCSTGPDYLIINGGQGVTTQVGDFIFALPLVYNPCNEEEHGTLAAIDSELSADCMHTFITRALNEGELLSANDARAQVGSGPLPIQPNQFISDMVVCGDAVYVAIDIAPDCDADSDASNDTGIFYSQALFDATGKIARWSPWKRATPFDAFPGVCLDGCLSHDGQVKFFEVDAKTGGVWIVEGTTDRFVGYTAWSLGACNNGLIKEISCLLSNGCYSILDLNQQTRGFEGATIDRYALFGGVNRVAVARISVGCDINNPLSPEEVISRFECDTNIFIDTLPDLEAEPCPVGAGCVTVLEYSRRTSDEGNQNYFFAGTETGLYAFSVEGDGFNVNQLTTLDQDPFISGEWQRVEGIDGAVIDIKTSGAKLYVLTMNYDTESPFINTLYSIEYTDSLNTMFAEPNITIIAQNNVGIFEDTCAFFAMAIISTGQVANDELAPQKEQLILATSTGLYQSNANQDPGNGIIDATNQTEAAWELIPGTETIAFDGIGFIDAPIEHTVWPISIVDACHHKTFDRSDINQISGTGNLDGTFADVGIFEPAFFNALAPCKKTCKTFNNLYPITYFWSDGGRRFFVINRTTSGAQRTQLAVMPYNVTNWNVYQFEPLFNPTLASFKQINWVRNVGASGLVLAGTNRGIVGLE